MALPVMDFQVRARGTGNSLSEALIFASTKPQYDDRLFIDLPVQYIKIPNLEHGETWGEHVAYLHKLF